MIPDRMWTETEKGQKFVSKWVCNHYGIVYFGLNGEGRQNEWNYTVIGTDYTGQCKNPGEGKKIVEDLLESLCSEGSDMLRQISPEEIWKNYVGGLSIKEFMAYSFGQTPEEAASRYAHNINASLDTHFSNEQLQIIGEKLAETIRAGLIWHEKRADQNFQERIATAKERIQRGHIKAQEPHMERG